MKTLSIATLSALFSKRSPQEKQEKQGENATGGDMLAADAFSDLIDSLGESSDSPPLGDGSPASLRVLHCADAPVADGFESEATLPNEGDEPAPEESSAAAPARVSPSETVLNWRNSLRAAIEGEAQMPAVAEAPLMAVGVPVPVVETPQPHPVHQSSPDETIALVAPVLPTATSASPHSASDNSAAAEERPERPVERRLGSFVESTPDQAAVVVPNQMALNSAQPAPSPLSEGPQAFAPAIRRARWAYGAEGHLSTLQQKPGKTPEAEAALSPSSARAGNTEAVPQVTPAAGESRPGSPDRATLERPTPSQWPLGVWRAQSAVPQDTSGAQIAEIAKPLGRISWVAEDRTSTASQMSVPSGQDPREILTALQGEAVLKPVAVNPASTTDAPPATALVGAVQPIEVPEPGDALVGSAPENMAASTPMVETPEAHAPELGVERGREVAKDETAVAPPPPSNATPQQAETSEPIALQPADVTEVEAPQASETQSDRDEVAVTAPEKASTTQAEPAQGDSAKPAASPRDPAHDMALSPRPFETGAGGTEELRVDHSVAPATSSAATQRAGATHGFGHQVADALVNAPNRAVELTLSPEELGKVRMTLHAQEGSMTVAVQAERPETLDLMRRHIDSLAREFREMGYADVSFDFGQQSNQQPKPQEQLAEAPPARERNPSGPFQSAAITAPDAADGASGGLDLRM